jgi:hypothetical protein
VSNVNALITLIEGGLEVNLIPVGIGALQILQKSPNIAGIEAAKLYILGNAPAALLNDATTLLQQEVTTLTAKLQAAQAAAAALQAAAANPAAAQAAAKPK